MLIGLSTALLLIVALAPVALAPPPGACEPWPSCKDGGGGGDGGSGATYRFTANIQGEYFDVAAQGTQSFIVSIDTVVEITSRFHVMVLPEVRITSIPDSYQGPALIYTSATTRAQVDDYLYETLAQDFGGFVYSQTWESGNGNDFATGKRLESLKVGQSTGLRSFDIFVTERRPWNEPLGAVDYTLFLKWPSVVSGTVTRTSETTWDFIISLTFTWAVFQRLPWSDYANRAKDLENNAVLNPTVTYAGSGTLTKGS